MPGVHEHQELKEIRARIAYDYDLLVKLDQRKCAFFSASDPDSYLNLAKDGLKVAMAAIDWQLQNK